MPLAAWTSNHFCNAWGSAKVLGLGISLKGPLPGALHISEGGIPGYL